MFRNNWPKQFLAFDFFTRTFRIRTEPNSYIGNFQKREIPWEKVPFVPRPSLVPDPVTAFGKRATQREQPKAEKLVITPLNKASIRPKILILPPKPYQSPRDATRERVFDIIRKQDLIPKELPSTDAMDVVLPKVHKSRPAAPYHRRIIYSAPELY